MSRHALFASAFALLALGCGATGVDTTFGRSRGSSVNGTGAFAELLRQRGHEVRAAVRANGTLANWANVLIRFAPHPGRPEKGEGRWLGDWLKNHPGGKLVYVVLDYDAEADFLEAMLAVEPKDASPEAIARATRQLDRAKGWVGNLPPRPKELAGEVEWFAFGLKPPSATPCQTLEGPWAEGVDAKLAAVPRHEAFKVEPDEPILLSGDGKPLAIAWTLDNDSQVLALANGSFLVNGGLLNRARRPLTAQVATWIGTTPLHVAFLEGTRPTADAAEAESSSPFRLLGIAPFDWVSAHVMGFLLLLALSAAVRLGRPSPEPPSGVERPSAHPEALGALLAKTGRADFARTLLETYRRWRHPSITSGRSPKAPTLPPR